MSRPKKVGHRFQKGNKAAVGNSGPPRYSDLTKALISQLNELDTKTQKSKLHRIVEQLIRLATGFVIVDVVKTRDGKKVLRRVEREIAADLSAIKYIWDRLEGTPKQTLGFGDDEGSSGKVTLIFERADEKV
jgi:hypothetical protein